MEAKKDKGQSYFSLDTYRVEGYSKFIKVMQMHQMILKELLRHGKYNF